MRKLLIAISYATIISALGLTALFFYWMLYPYRIIEFNEGVFPVLNENKTVKSGESLVYEVNYCKYIEVGSETTRSFVDGIIYTMPPIGSNKPIGCHNNTFSVEVPKGLPAGKMHLQMLYRFKVNPLRTVDLFMNTEDFTIIK